MDNDKSIELSGLDSVLFFIRKTNHGIVLIPHDFPRDGEEMIMDMLDVIHGVPNDYYISYNASTQTIKFERL